MRLSQGGLECHEERCIQIEPSAQRSVRPLGARLRRRTCTIAGRAASSKYAPARGARQPWRSKTAMTAINWTHPSVVRVLQAGDENDPLDVVERRARDLALEAIEKGWTGPPYDSFRLADALGIEVVARQDLEDARLVQVEGRPRIEFNPQRRPARIRFSVAHEIGHLLFDDYGDRTRYRDMDQRRADDWQLEVLCNVAAAELLMPAGALPIGETTNLDLVRLLDLRATFGVSTEALLRRLVRLTAHPTCLFAAARLDGARFRIDYVVPSRAWRPQLTAGEIVHAPVLARCTAVGYSDVGDEVWNGQELRVQAVGVPPYPGDRFPRVIGLLQPAHDTVPDDVGLRYVRGDASQPRGDGPGIIAHIVNNRAQRWGGKGFARSLMKRFPGARDLYASWPTKERKLGALHIAAAGDNLWIASLVAQAGYGPAKGEQPRLRLPALRQALEALAQEATGLQADVHMPLIGTGQGGTAWPKVRDLILEEVCARQISATVYVLADAPMPEDSDETAQMALL